jgi:hypothetical protein
MTPERRYLAIFPGEGLPTGNAGLDILMWHVIPKGRNVVPG